MRYFEFLEPYYALMQVENEDVANEMYIKYVTDSIEQRPIEIERDRALLLFSKGAIESGEQLSVDELIQDFRNVANHLLLIDGALI